MSDAVCPKFIKVRELEKRSPLNVGTVRNRQLWISDMCEVMGVGLSMTGQWDPSTSTSVIPEWAKTTTTLCEKSLLFVVNNCTAQKENILVMCFVIWKNLEAKRHGRKEQHEQLMYFCWGRDCLNKTLLMVAIRYGVYNRALHIQYTEQPLPA